MIQFNSLTLQRGKTVLLEQADLSIHSGQKVGLVGANGSGKSSLFKLLLGQLHADSGDVHCPGGWRIAHMAQEVEALERSALDHVLDGDEQLRQLQHEMERAEAEGRHAALGELHGRYDNLDGYTAESRAEQLLHGLGFTQAEVGRSVSEFSGGWRIRLNLAQALMCPSDLLLLDEPTNHLDLDAALWLEQWLSGYSGTLLLISHDRDFLDRVVQQIVHIEHQQTHQYSGNYSAFEQMRAERLAQQQAAFEKQQTRVAEIDSFVRRFKAKASKAKQAQSRIKELERMERIAPAHVDSPFNFHFLGSDKLSSPLLSLDEAQLGYAGDAVLSDISLSLLPDMRIGLLGANGAGKSTLIKTLMGELSLLQGTRVEGANLRIGYFAQHQLEALDLDASPLLHLQRLAPRASEQSIRDFLGGFNFYGDAALDAVRYFSGGEKARLALALLAWQRPNLLLMDEPTNHLDLEVRHALTLALQDFAGALILVSHDRHLLRNCVDQFWLIAEGSITEFDGDLDDYTRYLAAKGRDTDKPLPATVASKHEVQLTEEVAESAQQRRERKRLQAEQRQRRAPLKKTVERLERKMGESQQQLQQLEQQLADPALYQDEQKDRLQALLYRQAETAREQKVLEEQWLESSEELEALDED